MLAEAMAAGTIPIAYDVPYGPADLIDHGRNGLLVPSGDQDALAAAVSRLASLPPRRRRADAPRRPPDGPRLLGVGGRRRAGRSLRDALARRARRRTGQASPRSIATALATRRARVSSAFASVIARACSLRWL